MALSRKAKIGLGVLAGGAALLALGGAANAGGGGTGNTELPPRDPDCPRGFHREAPGGPCIADPLPPPTQRKIKDYVGSGWNWTRKDVFPTQQSFVDTLYNLGYPVQLSWDVLSGNFMQKVGWFQADYNAVISAFGYEGAKLIVDNLIGKNTIPALIRTEAIEDELGESWLTLVAQARSGNVA